jgi:hypothetical protein
VTLPTMACPPGGPETSSKENGCCRKTAPQNKIEIYGPKSDGSYRLELRQSDGQSLVVSVPASEAAVLKYFHARMPYGLVVPDVP